MEEIKQCANRNRQILRYYNILNYEPDISLNRNKSLSTSNHGREGERKGQKC